jgi:hypothetical protein
MPLCLLRGSTVRDIRNHAGRGAVALPLLQAESHTPSGSHHPGRAFMDGLIDPSRSIRPTVYARRHGGAAARSVWSLVLRTPA